MKKRNLFSSLIAFALVLCVAGQPLSVLAYEGEQNVALTEVSPELLPSEDKVPEDGLPVEGTVLEEENLQDEILEDELSQDEGRNEGVMLMTLQGEDPLEADGIFLYDTENETYAPVNNVMAAIALMAENPGLYGDTVYVNRTGEVGAGTWSEGVDITLQGISGDGSDVLNLGTSLELGGALTVEDLTLSAAKACEIFARGYDLTVGSGVSSTGTITVYGGGKSADVEGDITLTLNGGTYANVYGGGKSMAVTGDIVLTVGGNAVVTGSVYGGGYGAVVNGDVSVSVSGSGVSPVVDGKGSSNSIITAGGKANGKSMAYVTGKTSVVLEEGAVTYANIYGNYCGQGPADGSEAVSDEVVSTVIIKGLVTNKLGPTDREGRNVYGGIGSTDPANQLNGSTYVEVAQGGQVIGSVNGGGFGSSKAYAVIAGNTNVVIKGTARFTYGGGANNIINGNSSVTLERGGLVEETACAAGGGTGGRILGNATIDVYNQSPASVNKYPAGGNIPTIIEGGGPNGTKLMGNATVNVHPGAEVYYLYGGDRGEVMGDVNINVKDAAVVILVADLVAGAADAASAGKISVSVSGDCEFGSIYGNYSKTYGQQVAPRRESATVDFTDAKATVYRAWYDISSISLKDSTVEFLADEVLGDYKSMVQVGDLSVDDGSGLILNYSSAILGSFTGGETGTAGLTLPAGKKLLVGGTVSGKTALTIAESEEAPALEAQVYLAAQTEGSTGTLTWTDSKSPVRFTLRQNETVFGTTPDNANLTAEELEEQTGSATADQKWWLVKEAAPVNPDPDPTPDDYTVTVKYLEEGTGKILHDSYQSNSIREGRAYDVSEQAALTIKGYSISSVDGKVKGNIQRDLTVTVYYVADEQIDEEETPLTPKPELPGGTETPETEIPEAETPKTDKPEGDDSVILEPEVPLGNLPQTGTTQSLYGGIAALAMALSAAAVTVGITLRKKEHEEG